MMGTAVKGGQWCMGCKKPVAGQKTTHRARGAAGIAVGIPTLAIGDGYHCPTCGGPVIRDMGPGRRPSIGPDGKVSIPSAPSGGGALSAEQVAFWVIVACMIAVVIATH